MADEQNSELDSNMKQLRQHLVIIDSVLASMKDINSDAKTHTRGLERTAGMFNDGVNKVKNSKKSNSRDNFLGLSQRQLWSQIATAVSKAMKRGL